MGSKKFVFPKFSFEVGGKKLISVDGYVGWTAWSKRCQWHVQQFSFKAKRNITAKSAIGRQKKKIQSGKAACKTPLHKAKLNIFKLMQKLVRRTTNEEEWS